jgi:hypothetical protein
MGSIPCKVQIHDSFLFDYSLIFVVQIGEDKMLTRINFDANQDI